MALTADQKEAIMAARGASTAPVAKSNTRRYEMIFADGKQATMLDMAAEPEEVVIAGVTDMFKDGYVVSISLVR